MLDETCLQFTCAKEKYFHGVFLPMIFFSFGDIINMRNILYILQKCANTLFLLFNLVFSTNNIVVC